MSAKNGDRSRFHRQRKAKIQNRVRIRAVRAAMEASKGNSKDKGQD